MAMALGQLFLQNGLRWYDVIGNKNNIILTLFLGENQAVVDQVHESNVLASPLGNAKKFRQWQLRFECPYHLLQY